MTAISLGGFYFLTTHLPTQICRSILSDLGFYRHYGGRGEIHFFPRMHFIQKSRSNCTMVFLPNHFLFNSKYEQHETFEKYQTLWNWVLLKSQKPQEKKLSMLFIAEFVSHQVLLTIPKKEGRILVISINRQFVQKKCRPRSKLLLLCQVIRHFLHKINQLSIFFIWFILPLTSHMYESSIHELKAQKLQHTTLVVQG